jgi:hypothetical protein
MLHGMLHGMLFSVTAEAEDKQCHGFQLMALMQ